MVLSEKDNGQEKELIVMPLVTITLAFLGEERNMEWGK